MLCCRRCDDRMPCNRQIKLNLKLFVLGYLVVFCLSCIVLTESTKTIDSHLSNVDLERLNAVFNEALLSSDIQSIYYGALNIKDLQKKHSELCPKVTTLHKESKMNVSRLMSVLSATNFIPSAIYRISRKTFTSSTSTKGLLVRIRFPMPFRRPFR